MDKIKFKTIGPGFTPVPHKECSKEENDEFNVRFAELLEKLKSELKPEVLGDQQPLLGE